MSQKLQKVLAQRFTGGVRYAYADMIQGSNASTGLIMDSHMTTVAPKFSDYVVRKTFLLHI